MSSHAPDRAARGARLAGAGILVSRILGLVRMKVIAHYLGSGVETDAYTNALRIPNFLRNLLGEGAITASFVPVYAASLERDPRAARALANALLGLLLAGVAVLTIAGIALAPALTAVFVSGASAEVQALTTRLMRVMFPMAGIMVISGWCIGVQNAHRRFFISYAAAALWSAAQIVLLALAGPGEADLVRLAWWLSWATLAGAVLQVAAQLPQVRRLTEIRPTFDLRAPGLQSTIRNFLPVVSALGLFQISSLVDQMLASYLPVGSITNITYANLVYVLPLSLFGVATAVATLPELARDNAGGRLTQFAEGIARAWERVLFYTIPSALAFIAIGDCIVGLLYEGGAFDAEERGIVHLILAAYSLGLVAYASSRVMTSSFQAVQDYRTPFRAALAALCASTTVAAALALPFRNNAAAAAGIAAGSVVGAHVNFVLLWRALRGRGAAIDLSGPARVARSTIVAAGTAMLVSWGIRTAMAGVHIVVVAVVVIPAFSLVFIVLARMLKLAEADRLIGAVTRRIRPS